MPRPFTPVASNPTHRLDYHRFLATATADFQHDQVEILRAIADHPQRQEMRLAVAVLRDGARACALRFRSHDDERSVLSGESLAPRLTDALSATFDD